MLYVHCSNVVAGCTLFMHVLCAYVMRAAWFVVADTLARVLKYICVRLHQHCKHAYITDIITESLAAAQACGSMPSSIWWRLQG